MTTTAKTTTEIIELPVKIRLAKSSDFNREVVLRDRHDNPIPKKIPKFGQPYWLKSIKTGEFDNRNYQISEDTDWPEFKSFLRLNMVYVPLSYFELQELKQ